MKKRFCFYRWFALREVMRRLGLQSIIHLDSDVLLYFDPISEPIDLGAAELAIGSTSSYSGHFAWISSHQAIDTICKIMVHLFRDPTTLEELKGHFTRQAPYGGGVCDMYALGWIVWNQVMPVHELNHIHNGRVFDQAICDSRIAGRIEKWRMFDGRKVVKWIDRKPHFITLEQDLVRAQTIHFQGGAKTLMLQNMSSRSFRFLSHYIRLRACERLTILTDYIIVRLRHYRRGIRKRLNR